MRLTTSSGVNIGAILPPLYIILIILLLLVLFGGGFGFYRGGYYRQGGPVGIGLIAVVLVIGWLVHGHIGGVSF